MNASRMRLSVLTLLAAGALGFGNLKSIIIRKGLLFEPTARSSSRSVLRFVPTTSTSLQAFWGIDQGAVSDLAQSLFRDSGKVPFLEALGLNTVLFAVLRPKLFKMLTPAGYGNAFFLGTMLWHNLGWKGWSLCVCYLFLGQAVTKVRFAEKEKMGIAEARGGRRGPENVW
jgi:Integral membrane protein DUF92